MNTHIKKEDLEIWIRELRKSGYKLTKVPTHPFGIIIEKGVVRDKNLFIKGVEETSEKIIKNHSLELEVNFDKDLHELDHFYILKINFS